MNKSFSRAVIASMFMMLIASIVISCAGTAGGIGGGSDTALSVSLPDNRALWSKSEVQFFTVTISSSSYKETKSAAGGETITFSSIPVGIYNVNAIGKNSKGDITAKGTTTVEIIEGENTSTTVVLKRLECCTVTFHSKDASGNSVVYATKTVTQDYTVVAPAGANVGGQTFSFWTDTDGGTTPFDFTTPISRDIDLYAAFDAGLSDTIEISAANLSTVTAGLLSACASLGGGTVTFKVTDMTNSDVAAVKTLISNNSTVNFALEMTGSSFTSIATDSAFSSLNNLISVVLPDTITDLTGGYMFGYCQNLTSVTLPSGITSIPHNLFIACSSITGIVIPAGVNTIGSNAFTTNSTSTTISFADTTGTWRVVSPSTDYDDVNAFVNDAAVDDQTMTTSLLLSSPSAYGNSSQATILGLYGTGWSKN